VPIRQEKLWNATGQARGNMPAVQTEIPFAGAAQIQCPQVD